MVFLLFSIAQMVRLITAQQPHQHCIAIELGTSYSSVAVETQSKVEIIWNTHGNLRTPSVVSFIDNQTLVGEDAIKEISMNPSNTIYNIIR